MKDHSSHGQSRPFTTFNLPKWQLEIIHHYPTLYLKGSPGILASDPQQEDSCHLRYGFECDAGWAGYVDVSARLVHVERCAVDARDGVGANTGGFVAHSIDADGDDGRTHGVWGLFYD